MHTIYIAGPMTGLSNFNKPAFFEAEERLRQDGWLVVNPANTRQHPGVLRGDKIWQYYMREAIRVLVDCTAIALLPGWMDSKGAKVEYLIAQNLGMETWDYQDGELTALGARPPLDVLPSLPATAPAAGGRDA